jgi:hypothetical protein
MKPQWIFINLQSYVSMTVSELNTFIDLNMLYKMRFILKAEYLYNYAKEYIEENRNKNRKIKIQL